MSTKIQWTEATWNPLAGCTPVSPGCLNCYAATMAKRLEAMGQAKYKGLTVTHNGRTSFNGKITLDEDSLAIPLHRKKPTMYFVNSMSDLFHEAVPFEFIDRVFAVMALCPQHQFQVLTKRPERMAEYLLNHDGAEHQVGRGTMYDATNAFDPEDKLNPDGWYKWPLPNVWLGTSVENQQTADERIPHLLRCPAAIRFLSLEPLLGEVDLSIHGDCSGWACRECGSRNVDTEVAVGPDDVSTYRCDDCNYMGGGEDADWKSLIDWVIVGGESGPRARPCDVSWIRSIVRQCKAASVPVFVKQLGAKPLASLKECGIDETDDDNIDVLELEDPKGGNPEEWPADLRVREMPEVKHV